MLAQNRDHFLSQGLYYPLTGQVGTGGGQHNLAWELNGDGRFDPAAGTVADLGDELKEQHPSAVLISSEDLVFLYYKPDRLDVLRSLFDDLGYRVQVVVTLRDLPDYLESIYSQLVGDDLAGDFEEFLSDVLAQRGHFADGGIPVDYSQLVMGFASVFGMFGAESLRVVPYDRLDGISPLLRVCTEAVGAPLSAVPDCPRLNATGDRTPRVVLTAAQKESIVAALVELTHSGKLGFAPHLGSLTS